MQIKKTFVYLFSFIAVAMFIIWFFIIMLLTNRENLQKSQMQRLQLSSLADGFRLTQNNFSKYARNYVFTNGSSWEHRYFKLVERYKKNNSNKEIGFIENWHDSLATLGLTNHEFELLDRFRHLSFLTVSNELAAINAYNGIYIDSVNNEQYQGITNKELAQSLLFDKIYRQHKQEALLIVDEIQEKVGERTNRQLNNYSRNGKLIFLFLVIFIGLVILFSSIAYRLINKQLKLQLQDINERKAAEKALSLTEQQLQYAFKVSNEGLWDYNVNNQAFYCSPRTYELLGVNHKTNLSINDWLKLLSNSENDNNNLVEIIINEKVFEKIIKSTDNQGKTKWLHVKGSAVESDANNKPLRIVGTLNDITERMKQEEQIVHVVLETEDRERSRIASDIHDGLQQTMTTALLSFENVRTKASFKDADVEDRFTLGYNYLKKAITESRTLAHNLMPKTVDKQGLVIAIGTLLDAIKGSTETEFQFQQNLGKDRLKLAVEITLFRIVQESVTNITKHAKATKSDIQLFKHTNTLSLSIDDNGTGFDLSKTSHTFGLNSMKTRAESIGAYFEIESREGRGTHILIELAI